MVDPGAGLIRDLLFHRNGLFGLLDDALGGDAVGFEHLRSLAAAAELVVDAVADDRDRKMCIRDRFIVLYYNLIGANWNAATIGCVFCMVCCCFKGSHPGNVWPIMVGYVAASFATKGLCAALGTDFTTAINAQAIVIGLCFANGLSPVAGKYGWWAGIVFGVLHYALVTSVPFTHGGFLLYNGGFTAALICFLFIPVMEMFFKTRDEKAALRAKK